MVRLGRREVNRSHSPTVTDDDDMRPETPPPPQVHMQVRRNLCILNFILMESHPEKCTSKRYFLPWMKRKLTFLNKDSFQVQKGQNSERDFTAALTSARRLLISVGAGTGTPFFRDLSSFLINITQ